MIHVGNDNGFDIFPIGMSHFIEVPFGAPLAATVAPIIFEEKKKEKMIRTLPRLQLYQ